MDANGRRGEPSAGVVMVFGLDQAASHSEGFMKTKYSTDLFPHKGRGCIRTSEQYRTRMRKDKTEMIEEKHRG